MTLPGVVDPLTGATTPNPLDPTNPASGLSTAPVPAPIDLTQGVGLTGADNYNVQRLTRAQTYLSGALPNYPDLATAVGLAPTDWTTLDQHIQALGGQVGYGSGIGQLTTQLMQPGAPKVPVADISTLQQTLVKQGFMPPNTPIDGVWSSNWAAAMTAADDANYNKAQQGQKAGGASAVQFLSWLSDVLPSKVSQALVGTAKFLFGGIAHTVSRQAIEAAHAPGTFLQTLWDWNPADNAPLRLSQNPEVQAALKQHGLLGGAAGSAEDLASVLSVLPILRGAGVLQQGLTAAATQAGEQGLLTPVEGAVSKGLIASSVRTLTARAALADSPTAVGDLLNSYAGRTLSLRSLGEGFLNTADQLAGYKSTALGQGITAGLNALTQTAVGERAVANVTSGTVLPNIKLGKEDRSTLGQAIDNTPALGQSWRIPGLPGPVQSLVGNPLDLSAFIWAPTKVLPIGGSPTIGDMANSLNRITPTEDVMPLIRSTGMNRQQLVDAFGSEAGLKQGMRYFALQAAVNRDATLAVDATGLKPGADGWAEAVRTKAQDISTNLKTNPLAMERAISSASPIDILHQFQYLFGDQPQVLARRGQGQAVLSNWADATTAIKDIAVGPDPAVIESVKAQAKADVEAQGPAAALRSVPQADYYHGTSKPFAGDQLEPDRYMAGSGANNLFGPGVYVTDNPSVALSYTDKGYVPAEKAGVANKTVYGIKWTGGGTPNLIDLSQPLPANTHSPFLNFFEHVPGGEAPVGDDLKQLIADLKTQPGDQIYRELRQAMSDGGIPKYEADEHLEDLHHVLSEKGYDGFQYQGGQYTGSLVSHTATVFFDSSKLDVQSTTRTAEAKAALVEQRTKELLAQSNGGAGATVDRFTRGAATWTAANQDALNSALELFMEAKNIPPLRDAEGNLVTQVRAGGGGVPGSSYAFGEQMAGKLGEALGPDATIALRRADNALGSAQQLASWKIVWDRLGSVAGSLADRLASMEGGTVEAPKLLQVGDLNAAGVANQVVRDPRLLGLTGAQIPTQAATSLLANVTARLGELQGTMNKYYEETAKMDPGELSSYSNKLAQSAARDVSLSDSDLQQRLLGLGYQPVALHPGAITLNHVGPGVADGLGNAADVAPIKDFLGINKVRPEELQFMRTNATVNELGNLVNSGDVEGQSGKELMGRVWDTAKAANDAGRDIPGTNLTMERHVMDLRQLSVNDFQKYGNFTPSEAWQVYGAVRRGAAFGADISHPIATMRNFVDAMGYNGIPGIEDAIRTLVGLRPNTGVPYIDGPAGHILNLPDDLARARDFIQFSMSPMFSAAKAFKTKILRGTEGLPFDYHPAERIKDLAADSGNADEFTARFNNNYRRVMGESRGNALATLMDNPDYGIRNPGSGLFSHSNEPGIALDAWHLAQQARQDQGILSADEPLSANTYQGIKDKVQGIYGYGPRSGLEKSANYVFFPLSFDLKVGKALGGWALQNPARILAISAGLQAYNQANQNNAIGGFFDRYLPALKELNKLNFFTGGFHTQLTPIGGRNTALWNLGKDVEAMIAQDPRLGAYVPVSVSDNDLPSMLGMFANLVPMWRQMQTGGKALTSQLHVAQGVIPAVPGLVKAGAIRATGGTAALPYTGGSDQWQVDNYYQTMTDLKKQVSIALGNAGLKPSFSTLTDPFGNPNSKISPEFFNQVQAAIGQVEAKYPAGAAFAKRTSADYQTRANALDEMLRKPVKDRADASMLYFAAAYYDLQAQAQTSARANNAQGRAGRALYQQIAGAMAQGTTPPTLPGDLDAGQVAQLRRLALGLVQDAGPEFLRQYNLLFRSELGPLRAYEEAPGTAPTAAA